MAPVAFTERQIEALANFADWLIEGTGDDNEEDQERDV